MLALAKMNMHGQGPRNWTKKKWKTEKKSQSPAKTVCSSLPSLPLYLEEKFAKILQFRHLYKSS